MMQPSLPQQRDRGARSNLCKRHCMKAICHPVIARGNNRRVKGRNRKMWRAGTTYALAVKIHAMDMRTNRPDEEYKSGGGRTESRPVPQPKGDRYDSSIRQDSSRQKRDKEKVQMERDIE